MIKNKLDTFFEIANQLHALSSKFGLTKETTILLLKLGDRKTTTKELIDEISPSGHRAEFNEKFKIKLAKDTKKLFDLGFINKTQSNEDKRVYFLSPTEKGMEVINEWNKNV